MRFSRLLESARIPHRRLGRDVEVASVTDDSRRCAPGSCFVAVRGVAADGHDYLPQALAAGASAIVCEDDATLPSDLPRAIAPEARAAAGPLAQAMLDWPARKLVSVGVTGTNGKTTVTALTQAILVAAGHSCASLGTITYDTGKDVAVATNTTPGPVALARMTAEMVEAGRTHLVMEASSHALDQHRTDGMGFRVGVFTNLTGDHLDYHGTRTAYMAAKRRLFASLPADGAAVVNWDDPAGAVVVDGTSARLLRYGLTREADLHADVTRADATGARFVLTLKDSGESAEVATSLIGLHNVSNCLAAAGAALAVGVSLETTAAALAAQTCVRGRLERVGTDAPYDVFVDYAHTDDALANVLTALRGICGSGRLLLVFGCGGDRDKSKRPRMASVAQSLADEIVVTSDNPRSESPEAIIADIVAGFGAAPGDNVHVEGDRRAAIELAASLATPGDVVLIAGKGHEDYQIIGDRRVHFDDVETAREIITAGGRRS